MAKASTTLVSPCGYGLYLGDSAILLPPQALADGNNFKITNRSIDTHNLGWSKFTSQVLDGTPLFIETFNQSNGSNVLITGTAKSLYRYNTGSSKWLYINPRYVTGTLQATSGNATLVGSGTTWTTNAKIGDKVYIGSNSQNDPTATGTAPTGWYTITLVTDNTHIDVTPTPSASTGGATNYTIVKIFSGNNLQPWATETFPSGTIGGTLGDYWFATNFGVDYPVYWNGSDATVTSASALAFKCKSLKRYHNMMLYLNCVTDGGLQQPFTVKNSDVGLPITMAGGLANEFIVAPNTYPIVTQELIGDSLAVYTENEIVLMDFTDAADVIFTFRTVVSGIGILAPRLLTVFSDHHEFVGHDGLWTFNGVQCEPKDTHIWPAYVQTADLNRVRASFSFKDEPNNQSIWALTLSTDSGAGSSGPPASALTGHYLEENGPGVPQPYGKRDFPFACVGQYQRTTTLTWADLTNAWNTYTFSWNDKSFAGNFPLLLAGKSDGIIYSLNTQDTQDGTAYRSFARFGVRPVGDMRHRNLLKRVYPMAQLGDGNYSLTATAYLYDHEGLSTYTSMGSYDLTLVGQDNFVTPYRRGRFAQIEFSTSGSTSGQPWRLDGYDIDVAPGGGR